MERTRDIDVIELEDLPHRSIDMGTARCLTEMLVPHAAVRAYIEIPSALSTVHYEVVQGSLMNIVPGLYHTTINIKLCDEPDEDGFPQVKILHLNTDSE